MAQPQDNSQQSELWNGPTGNTWTEFQDGLDEMLAPITEQLIPAIDAKPGERILDIGCGNGQTSLMLARAVGPEGHVTGLDISGVLLQNAAQRSAAAGLDVEWVEADASMHAFKPDYDKLVSRFGIMFFAEPIPAFANMRTALKPGGEMIFICWRKFEENLWMTEPLELAAQFVEVPPRPEGHAPGPFALADKPYLENVLAEAGFTDVEMTPIDWQVSPPGATLDEQCNFVKRLGPLGVVMREANETDRARLEAALRSWLEERAGRGITSNAGASWLVRAKNP